MTSAWGTPGLSDLQMIYNHFYDKSPRGFVVFEEISREMIFSQVSRAVEHLHSQNCAHCDIKPENILVDRNWMSNQDDFRFDVTTKTEERVVIQLIDLACAVTSMTHTGPLIDTINTISYSAPELLGAIRPSSISAFPCDLWGLGIVLHLLCIGPLCFHYDQNDSPYISWDMFCDQTVSTTALSLEHLDILHREMTNNIEKMHENVVKSSTCTERDKTRIQNLLSFDPSKRTNVKCLE